MHRNILVPVDGSPLSEYAVPFAIEIARRGGGRVKILRVLGEPILPARVPVSVQASERKLARAETDRLLAAHKNPEVPIEADVRIGLVLDEILRAAAKEDLVVMTTHGRGGIRRWVMGSVADRVVRLGSKPVLVIHPPKKRSLATAEAAALRMFRDALVALDGSPLAEQALGELKQFATGDTRIHFLRVVEKNAGAPARDLAESYLRDAASSLEARGVKVEKVVAAADSPAEAIADTALRRGCGVIVMTTRGAGEIARWILGGVTDKVVRLGPTPVLVIRASRPLWKGGRRPLAAGADRPRKKSVTVI
jgi:nucleotide-binding universal stress UspA family protein